MNKGPLHIVCLDAPAPPDYGGVYDLYYKIIALHHLGYKITLHYFSYKKGRSAEGLQKFCTAIYAYERASFIECIFSANPFIVQSRIDKELIERLNNDRAPVILEGIHCTGIIPFIDAYKRKVVVRMHNNEAAYYKALGKIEKNLFKKMFLLREGEMLEKYQQKLFKDLHYSFVSAADKLHFENEYGLTNCSFIPAFIPWQQIAAKTGFGKYCLYQGNLSVSENEEAVIWLLENVWNNINIPIVIAGKQPRADFREKIKSYSAASLIANPSAEALSVLIAEAHIHLLPSFNTTGVKLKLLHALFDGRFCITNQQGIAGSGITKGVLLADSADDYKLLINQYMKQEFTEANVEERSYLTTLYNNQHSAEKLSAFL